MIRIQCVGCRKIFRVKTGGELLKWFNHSKQTKCIGGYKKNISVDEDETMGSSKLEEVEFEESEYDDLSFGDVGVAEFS